MNTDTWRLGRKPTAITSLWRGSSRQAEAPPHIQTREEEGFYILEGTVTFWVDGDEIEANTGTFLHVP